MNAAIVAFTQRGADLAAHLQEVLCGCGYETEPPFLKCGKESESLHAWTERAFRRNRALIFVGATGIAVRSVAPFLKDKMRDPAVLSIDEQGKFVIPLVSGHVGGANRLAKQIADAIGATAVITTATDLSGVFAVDSWAVELGMSIGDRTVAKEVSAVLLDGGKVGISSEFTIEGKLPDGITKEKQPLGILVSLGTKRAPFSKTLHLVPKIVTIGVGCRKDLAAEVFEKTLLETLERKRISLCAVRQLATITLKENEECILSFCRKYDLPLKIASPEVLSKVEGKFSVSEFVYQVTGVDNVCERAAVHFSGGKLLFPKRGQNGVTVAAAAPVWTVTF